MLPKGSRALGTNALSPEMTCCSWYFLFAVFSAACAAACNQGAMKTCVCAHARTTSRCIEVDVVAAMAMVLAMLRCDAITALSSRSTDLMDLIDRDRAVLIVPRRAGDGIRLEHGDVIPVCTSGEMTLKRERSRRSRKICRRQPHGLDRKIQVKCVPGAQELAQASVDHWLANPWPAVPVDQARRHN